MESAASKERAIMDNISLREMRKQHEIIHGKISKVEAQLTDGDGRRVKSELIKVQNAIASIDSTMASQPHINMAPKPGFEM